MNVSAKVTDLPDGSGGLVRKRVLVVNKDFKAGDVIYKEQPLVSALDSDLEGKGSHCSYCLRQITKGMAIRPDTDRLNSVYCSKDCQVKSNAQSQNLLFGIEHPIPPALRQDTASADVLDARREAQTAFLEIVRQPGQVAAMLVARLIARQISVEIAKMLPGSPTAATSVADGIDSEYPIYDHIERLRYLELPVSDGKVAPLRSIFETALPGLEQFITDERYQILTGKMAYNAFGVAFAGGRDDRPITDIRPEDLERTRTPYGTARQIGAGFYMVSSYIAHSCDPSARPSFSGGTAELHLIANRDLKAGDEVTVAFVDVAQHEGESIVDARRRRRIELARGWRFACPCERCAKEDPGHGEEVQKDESKVEEPVRRFDEGVAQAQASMID
ncbi:hypothetical protein BV25DRAFT_25399 [Artomyces pyxidatus]|uniref:Uncharacterized protein n=1 Tax=Artomyces pyxidatus TaxID=48021 RepID=A0ACB8TJT4_9AGAM|nr:hypothetical protein BV25DRAFT_25399 [Artomyces pyxidatus]